MKSKNGRKAPSNIRFFTIIDVGRKTWAKARESVELANSW